ncbi:hypothetical protein SeMB42_g01024 [Synchytrium endobioticum]|uniref:Uncharacterized protein n=1 Tax=Synchytrium endobioticum TaxID=286115 RepID=A0A507DNB0_9FUNG|nr:hypothetical protein SeLEV6574_g00478 [Synchytrium endobioticum]TPX53073.1 hypothetical protein SeMB42_g01024 [Synchytrium endobioticum]
MNFGTLKRKKDESDPPRTHRPLFSRDWLAKYQRKPGQLTFGVSMQNTIQQEECPALSSLTTSDDANPHNLPNHITNMNHPESLPPQSSSSQSFLSPPPFPELSFELPTPMPSPKLPTNPAKWTDVTGIVAAIYGTLEEHQKEFDRRVELLESRVGLAAGARTDDDRHPTRKVPILATDAANTAKKKKKERSDDALNGLITLGQSSLGIFKPQLSNLWIPVETLDDDGVNNNGRTHRKAFTRIFHSPVSPGVADDRISGGGRDEQMSTAISTPSTHSGIISSRTESPRKPSRVTWKKAIGRARKGKGKNPVVSTSYASNFFPPKGPGSRSGVFPMPTTGRQLTGEYNSARNHNGGNASNAPDPTVSFENVFKKVVMMDTFFPADEIHAKRQLERASELFYYDRFDYETKQLDWEIPKFLINWKRLMFARIKDEFREIIGMTDAEDTDGEGLQLEDRTQDLVNDLRDSHAYVDLIHVEPDGGEDIEFASDILARALIVAPVYNSALGKNQPKFPATFGMTYYAIPLIAYICAILNYDMHHWPNLSWKPERTSRQEMHSEIERLYNQYVAKLNELRDTDSANFDRAMNILYRYEPS